MDTEIGLSAVASAIKSKNVFVDESSISNIRLIAALWL
jgi:hypothetical protein